MTNAADQTAARLRRQVAQQIASSGAVTVAEFMRLVLAARHLGYYATRDPLGAGGDFITAPEISQMFGEMIGLWCVDTWHRLGRPNPFRLVELGPGRGTLMADALRAARLAPDFLAAADLHLVEISEPLKTAQQGALSAYRPQWHETIHEVPRGPMLLVANEFFDALPIHQFERTAEGWRERGVALAPDDPDKFVWTLMAPGPQAALLTAAHLRAAPGEVAEISPISVAICSEIATRCCEDGGVALLIDYGHAESGLGDTFQALKQHRYHDPLADIGGADLTAHVDFAMLGNAARSAGARALGPVTQGSFLRSLGIEMRAQLLSQGKSPALAADITQALHRLIDPGEMGTLFKVIALTTPHLTELAGF